MAKRHCYFDVHAIALPLALLVLPGFRCPGPDPQIRDVVCPDGDCETCPTGFTVCGDWCVDTSSDPDHCGGCDNACAEGEECVNSTCRPVPPPPLSCEEGLTLCGDWCVDTSRDPNHCGDCDTACAEGEECSDGSCQPKKWCHYNNGKGNDHGTIVDGDGNGHEGHEKDHPVEGEICNDEIDNDCDGDVDEDGCVEEL